MASRDKPRDRGMMEQAEKKLRIARRIGNGPAKGRFYYSKTQRRHLDDNGRPRFFFKRFGDGSIIEYTELIDFQTLRENPGLKGCGPADYPDAEYCGEGEFLMSVDH